MGTLEILLLGGFQLRRSGSVLDPIPSRAARSLFSYLVLNRDRVHTRDLAAGVFWPDMADSRARRRLSQALWQIRSTLGDRYLRTTSETIRFDPDVDFWLDVDEFEWTIEQADPDSVASRSEEAALLTSAVDLYRGDLLAGFYDDWMLTDQDRLRERFLGALARLSDLAMAAGEYEAALINARRLAHSDPLREDAHRNVMRAAMLLGRHNEALRQYELCRDILSEELGAEPSAETRQLYEATLTDRERAGVAGGPQRESPLFGAGGSVPIVGRDREHAVLVELLDRAIDGTGAVVLLEGEAGVGKTRLLAEVVDDARWRGMDVLWGRSGPSGGRPFGPLVEAMSGGVSTLRSRRLSEMLAPAWRDPLVPLLPALADASQKTESTPLRPTEEQARLREAMALAIGTLASLGPLMVVIDDVHWADEDTVHALEHLVARLDEQRVVLVLSYRHAEARERTEVWGLLRSADRRAHCERVSLPPFTPAQTEELVRGSVGVTEVGAEFSERLHRQTSGIPLLILETLRALHERGELDGAADRLGEHTPVAGLPLTEEVHGLIRRRLAGLDDTSAATLQLLSVHTGGLEAAEVVDALENDEHVTLAALDDLVGRRLVDEESGRFAVSHEIMRRVVHDDLSPEMRVDLHQRVAVAIERHRPDLVEALAHHLVEGAVPDRAAHYLALAADRAIAVHAYEMAAHHLDAELTALDLTDAPAGRRFVVAGRLEQVLDTLARRDEQEAAIAVMERCATDGQLVDVHRRRAWWLAHMDRFADAVKAAEASLDLAHRQPGEEGRVVAAQSTLGMIACFAGRAAEGVAHLEAAVSLPDVPPAEEADARNALGQNLIDLQRFEEAEHHLVAALSLYGDLDDKRGQADVTGMLGMMSMERGQPEAAEAYLLRAIEISTAIGYRHGEAVHRMNLGILQALSRRVLQSIATFDEAATTYEQIGNRRGQAMVMSNSAWLRHSNLGRDDEAAGQARQALQYYEEIGDRRGEAQCIGTLASIAWKEGRLAEARRLFGSSLSSAEASQDSWLVVQIKKEWALAECRSGHESVALPLAEEALHLARTVGLNDLRVTIQALVGRIYLEMGDPPKALAATSSAMAGFEADIESGYLIPYFHSLALLECGERPASDSFLDAAWRTLMGSLEGLPDEEKEAAIELVPLHSEIAEMWRSRQPLVSKRWIASVEVPRGRAVREDELVGVSWTLAHPDDDHIEDTIARRRHRLTRLIEEAAAQGGAPTIEDLAGALETSIATVRRDLAALRSAGADLPTRGRRAQ